MNNQKLAYLTIDDAPTGFFSEKMEYLLSKNIPAIFYCLGENLDRNFNMAVTALKKGFILGNHSYSHPHFSELTQEQAFNEIKKTDDLLSRVYEKAGLKFNRYFRFPYGDKGSGEVGIGEYPRTNFALLQSIQDYLKQLGYQRINFPGITYPWYVGSQFEKDIDAYWTYDCEEWRLFVDGLTENDILSWMDKVDIEKGKGINTPGSNEIVLLHDHDETTDLFPLIIDKFLSKNVKFILPDV